MLELKFNILFIFKTHRVHIVPLVVLVLFMESCGAVVNGSSLDYYDKDERPRNIILMIGDGMGLSQFSYVSSQNNNGLRMELMPVIGFHKTYAHDNLITDSA